MAFCRQCGNKLGEEQKFCPVCGAKVGEVEAHPQPTVNPAPVYTQPVQYAQPVEQAPAKEPVVYTIFSIIGLIGGICSMVLSVTFIYSFFALFSGIPSLVLSAIAKKSVKHHGKAKAGFVLSLISVIIGGLFVLLLLTIIPLIPELAELFSEFAAY